MWSLDLWALPSGSLGLNPGLPRGTCGILEEFTLLAIQQTHNEHLLCSRHIFRPWGYNGIQDKQGHCLCGAYILESHGTNHLNSSPSLSFYIYKMWIIMGPTSGEDEMVGSPTWWTLAWVSPGVGDGQGSLVYCSPWGRRVAHNWATHLTSGKSLAT